MDLDKEKIFHPQEQLLAGFLARTLPRDEMKRIEGHISSCDKCLVAVLDAFDTVSRSGMTRHGIRDRLRALKKVNIYLLLTAVSFSLSFIMPRFFIQLLVATLLFGIKCITDSRSARMLLMINEAWKKNGEKPDPDPDQPRTVKKCDTNRIDR